MHKYPMNLTIEQIAQLRDTLIEEIVKGLGVLPGTWRSKILKPFVWLPTQRFAELGAAFDQYVASRGLHEAASWVLPRFIKNLDVHHEDEIPTKGPLIVAANHPGTVDSLAIVASLPRPDLKIIASAIPFIRGLPSTAKHIIYTTLNPHERMMVIRSAIRHLKEGGALLIFPSGNIDPDPAVLPGAEEALRTWSPSLEIMLRRVPQSKVVVTIISGVLSPSCFRNPLTRLRKHLRDQQRLAEFIQVIQQMLFGEKFELVPKITYGEPLSINEIMQNSNAPNMLQNLIEKARNLMSVHFAT